MMRIGLCAVTMLALLAWVDAACEDDQVAHCSSCSNPGVECIHCPNGWIIDAEKHACEPCPDNCAECERTSGDVLRCVDCHSRYALRDVDGVCVECTAGCASCVHKTGDVTDCKECFVRWVSVVTGDVNACLECPGNCNECKEADDGSATCTSCVDYYFLKSDRSCKRCPSNCITCSDNGEGKGLCSKCRDSYKVPNDDATKSCLLCPSACSSCTNDARSGTTAVCDACHPAWALDNDDCVVCDVNCVVCESSTTCAECADGYRVDSGSCVACSSHCKGCSLDEGTEICDVCFESWVPKDEKSCDECGSRCRVCNLNGFCSTCDQFYEPDTNGNCQKCPSKCNDCTYSSTFSKTWCRSGQCEVGYTVDDRGDCAACPSGCNDNGCSWSNGLGETICNSCNNTVQTRTLNTDRTRCYDCPADCDFCSYNNTGLGRVVCDICDAYFEVQDEGCDPCPEACDSCAFNVTSSAMDCDGLPSCDVGYRFGEDEGADGNDICVRCGVSDCSTCNATDACILCVTPFKLRDDGGECRACPDHCSSCNWNGDQSDTLCVSDGNCDTYYGLSSEKKCPACRSHCRSCPQDNSGDNPCRGGWCDTEYTDDRDGNCKSCPGKCRSCTYDTGDKRTKCQSSSCYDRYALITSEPSDGNCASCPENCDECSWEDDGEGEARTWCTVCDRGFDLRPSDGLCVACPDNCWVCTYNEDTDDTECDSNDDCYSCYGITPEFNCDACPYNCDDCTYNEEVGIMQCDDCKDHYVQNDGVCGACPDHCSICSHSAGNIECTTCDDKYALFQGECLSCPSNCEECTANANGVTQCKENMCKRGYGRNSKKTCSTCQSMFENCNLCSDTTGFNADGADICDCYSCSGAYTLADDSSVCKDTFPGTCSQFEDRNWVCSNGNCDEGYAPMGNGSCTSQCYTCGNTRNNQLMDWDTCVANWVGNENSSAEICIHDCWVVSEKIEGVDKKWRVARGCHIPDDDIAEYEITCEKSKGRNCKTKDVNGQKVTKCWRCCDGKLCNDMDGGSAAIQACFGLLAAAIFALLM